jgi:hypothetical protein
VAFRVATFQLDDLGQRTPSGGLLVNARIARTGIQTYHRPDGSEIKEYRPEEEVFSDASLASWRGATVTDLHPVTDVNPSNWKDLAKGHVSDEVVRDGNYVKTRLYIEDADLIQAVQSGQRKELSGGYHVQIDETPGEFEGERYDRIQRNIRGNHVATLPPGMGRAGPEVAIRLDASDNVIIETVAPGGQEEWRMITIQIDGVDYQVEGPGAEPLRQALGLKLDASHAKLEQVRSELSKARSDLEETRGRADTVEKEAAKLKTKITELEDPAHIDAMAQARADLTMDARKLLGDPEADFAGKSAVEIMAMALGEELRDDTSENYLRGAFHMALKISKEDPGEGHLDSVDQFRMQAAKGERTDELDELDKILRDKLENGWRQPLAISIGGTK